MKHSPKKKKSVNVLNFICKSFFTSILFKHLAFPFELLERVLPLEEELADHSLKRTFGKQGIR